MWKAACKVCQFAESFGSDALPPSVCCSFAKFLGGKLCFSLQFICALMAAVELGFLRIGRAEESTAWKESGPSGSFGAWVV